MMKSQFDGTLAIARRRIGVNGPFVPVGGPDGHQFVLWMVRQDEVCGAGVSHPVGDGWAGVEEVERDWVDGPAVGLAVAVNMAPAGVQTFTWQQDVTLRTTQT